MNSEDESAIDLFNRQLSVSADEGSHLPPMSVDQATALKMEIERIERRRDDAAQQRDEAIETARSDRNYREETLKQFADLKERLHASEMEQARLSGYFQRVNEDDIARDGHEVISAGDETFVKPRRPAPMVPHRDYEGGGMVMSEMGSRERVRRVHWVNYGR